MIAFVNKAQVWQMADEAQLLQHCAPVFFLPHKGALPETINNNATLALVDTGSRAVLVTCCHVWDKYLADRDAAPSTVMATVFANGFGQPIHLAEDRLIDLDRGLDLVVFEASPEIWSLGNKRFYRPERWPIPAARIGEVIAFVGFPGQARKVFGAVGNFEYSFFGLSVTSVSDRKMVLAAGPTRGHVYDNSDRVVSAMRMGGLSGSPAYVRSRNGLFSLAGFVQMGATSDDDIFLTHASFLTQDGTLRR